MLSDKETLDNVITDVLINNQKPSSYDCDKLTSSYKTNLLVVELNKKIGEYSFDQMYYVLNVIMCMASISHTQRNATCREFRELHLHKLKQKRLELEIMKMVSTDQIPVFYQD